MNNQNNMNGMNIGYNHQIGMTFYTPQHLWKTRCRIYWIVTHVKETEDPILHFRNIFS
jgi:hypothetical protein